MGSSISGRGGIAAAAHSRSAVRLTAGLFLLLLCTGCHDYRWRWDFHQAEADARTQQRDMFIFYKWWLSDDSNRMHGEVLTDPQVGPLFSDTINVLLEKDSEPQAPEYMTKYGVTAPPAFVVVAPDGSFEVRTGYLPKDQFIEFIRSARSTPPAAKAASP